MPRLDSQTPPLSVVVEEGGEAGDTSEEVFNSIKADLIQAVSNSSALADTMVEVAAEQNNTVLASVEVDADAFEPPTEFVEQVVEVKIFVTKSPSAAPSAAPSTAPSGAPSAFPSESPSPAPA